VNQQVRLLLVGLLKEARANKKDGGRLLHFGATGKSAFVLTPDEKGG
jgi:hypothetical protein